MADDRVKVLSRVRAALATRAVRAPMPTYVDDVALARSAVEGRSLGEAFALQLAAAGGFTFTDPAALGEWLVGRGMRRGYCDPSLVAELGRMLAPSLVIETKLARDRIDDYDFGVTRAAGAIAETGSIVLNDATTSRRLAALAPWVHVAVVREADIHRSVADAIRALGSDPYVVWCTGPSKTADVEGILIQGVHGPGEQVALVLP